MALEKNSPLGNWRVSSDDNTALSLYEGLAQVRGEKRMTIAGGPTFLNGPISFPFEAEINTSDTSGLHEVLKAAEEAEIAILAVGEHGFHSGEARSRMSLRLPGLQEHMIREVLKVQDHVVIVLYTGRPMILPEDITEQVDAILLAWQPGTMGGPAIANLLMGKRSPSGRLPVTFPRSEGQIPLYYGAYNTGRPGPSDAVFWSHYGDGPNSPAYPFGYGLSYSKVTYAATQAIQSGDSIVVQAYVRNVGKVVVDEVVQLYARDHHSRLGVQPVRRLIGFQRVTLKPGEERMMTFNVTKDLLNVVTSEGERVFEPGTFSFWVAPHSADGTPASIDWE
jgi:beta-glucosidase